MVRGVSTKLYLKNASSVKCLKLDKLIIKYKHGQSKIVFNEIYKQSIFLTTKYISKFKRIPNCNHVACIDDTILYAIKTYKRRRGSFSIWLIELINYTIGREWRKYYTKSNLKIDDLEHCKNIAALEYPEDNIIAEQLYKFIYTSLPEKYRQIYLLLLDDVVAKDIAYIMGISKERLRQKIGGMRELLKNKKVLETYTNTSI